jgi:hypothetical protein
MHHAGYQIKSNDRAWMQDSFIAGFYYIFSLFDELEKGKRLHHPCNVPLTDALVITFYPFPIHQTERNSYK